MNFDQFVSKYCGKYIDYDKAYGFQCVDLIRAYFEEVLGFKPYIALPPTGWAKNIFKNFPDEGNQWFAKVYNQPTNFPKKGDVIFFKTSLLPPWLYGLAGHTAVVYDANVMSLISFDQNYPTGTSCHFQRHTYKDCLGWLTPKK